MQKQRKMNKGILFRGIASFGIVFSLLCSGPVLRARYMTTLTLDTGFAVRASSKVYLSAGSGTDTKEITTGQAALPWESSETTKTQSLSFRISNGDRSGQNVSETDMSVKVRLFVPDPENSAGSGLGNLTVILENKQGAAEYLAKAEYLSTKTAMYREYGAGWVYCFYDTAGNELSVDLSGGTLKNCDLMIMMEFPRGMDEENATDIASFRLCVDKFRKM